MFADDPICSTQTRIYTFFLKVNVELQKINEWFICNKLSLNVKKKQIFGPSKKDDILLVLSKLNLNN